MEYQGQTNWTLNWTGCKYGTAEYLPDRKSKTIAAMVRIRNLPSLKKMVLENCSIRTVLHLGRCGISSPSSISSTQLGWAIDSLRVCAPLGP